MRVKIASIESSITPIIFFALFPIDQHLQHEQQQQQQQIGEIQNSRQRNFGRMASYSDDEESEEETEYPKPNSEILPVDLEPDISLILKLMPDKAYDEVRFMLEAHQNDPSRVQVIKIFIHRLNLVMVDTGTRN